MSFEISERLSSALSGISFSQWALSKFGSYFLFLDDGFDFTASGSSQESNNLFGELESFDRDDLSFDILSINEDSFITDDINDGGKFSLFGTEADASDSTYLDKSCIALS